MVEKTVISDVMAADLVLADVGGAGVTAGQLLVDVPTGKAFYLTGIYGITTAAGTVIIWDSADGTDLATVGASMSLYLSLTGDGAGGFVLGPFTNDVYIASDGVAEATAERITATGYVE